MPQGPYLHQASPMMDLNYMRTMITEMLNEYKEQETVSTYIIGKPFPPRVEATPFPPKFVYPHFNTFNGTMWPKQHIAHFESQCGAIAQQGDLLLKLFVQSLDSAAFTWYSNLKPNSISDWDQWNELSYNSFMAHTGLSSCMNWLMKDNETMSQS